MHSVDGKNLALARVLILDELLDLQLYRQLRTRAVGDLAGLLDELIVTEARHLKFWQTFYGMGLDTLDLKRRIKLRGLVFFCRIFGDAAAYLVLEAIEIYGIKKYLRVWKKYKDGPLGKAVRSVLEDELQHEDTIVSRAEARKIQPERIRNIFLGMNDGLVEMLGAVSGFFAAFQSVTIVIAASMMVAIAGALSMAAGAFAATSSQREVEDIESGKRAFVSGEITPQKGSSPLASAFVVGISYAFGALIPIMPVLLGARSVAVSFLVAGIIVVGVSYVLAFLSGMNIRRRIVLNVSIIILAVGVTYGIGVASKSVFGFVV